MYALPGEHKGPLQQRFYRRDDALTFEHLAVTEWESEAGMK